MTLFVVSYEGEITVTAIGLPGSTFPLIILSSTNSDCCSNNFSLITMVPVDSNPSRLH